MCMKYNIDIMFDDSVRICNDCIDNRITAILMDTPYNKYSNIKRVRDWEEFYQYVMDYKKINLILDTDTYNECDDQFALAYLLKCQDLFNIEAITIAPFSHKSVNVSTSDGQKLSYNEILKICSLEKFNTDNKVFMGSIDYIQNGYYSTSPAVDKIIEIALKNDKTYILEIGAITNVALAIYKNPEIVNRIEVIWLGGNELGYKDNLEYNFRQDIEAVKIVFDSKAKLTILPCRDVVSDLKIDMITIKKNLENKSELANYLIGRFYNDGYHELKKYRVIWDISVVAYLINKDWFETRDVSCPNIGDFASYELTNNRHSITFVTKLDRNKIYNDLFRRLG